MSPPCTRVYLRFYFNLSNLLLDRIIYYVKTLHLLSLYFTLEGWAE